MRILEKYVLKSYVVSFLFCIVLLIVLGVIGDILGFLDDIMQKSIPLKSILSFYFYLGPFAFVNMAPFATLLASVYVFNSLSKNHEVTAVIASGLSLWQLLRPVLFVTFALCLFIFIVNDAYVPQTMRLANRIKWQELETVKSKGGGKIRNIAVYGKGDQIIFAKSYTPSKKTMENVIIHRQDKDHDITQKVSARLVKWEDGSWVGEDVIIFNLGDAGKFSSDPDVFKTRAIDIRETPQDFIDNEWDPKYMSYSKLKTYLNVFASASKTTVRRLKVELNHKIAFPFTALITVLVGVPFSIETGRSNPLIGMARGITVAVLYLPVMAVSLALGKGGTFPPVLSAWLSNILFVLLGIYYINRKS